MIFGRDELRLLLLTVVVTTMNYGHGILKKLLLVL